MKPVYQTIFGKPLGNCLQAAVASIFELPLEDVPNFRASRSLWWEKYQDFCRERGVYPLRISPESIDGNSATSVLEGYHLMTVETERGLLHSVVGLKGEIVHDPYPGGSTITKIVEYEIFASLMEGD